MLRRRHLLAVAWILLYAVYWWRFVPRAPETIIRPPDGYSFHAETRSGDIAVCLEHQLPLGEAYRCRRSGPVQIFSSKDGSFQREFLDVDEWLLAVSAGGGLVAADHLNTLKVVNLETGEPLFERTQPGPISAAAISADEQLIAVASSQTVSVLDRSGETLWTREIPSLPAENLFQPGPGHVRSELEILRFVDSLLMVDIEPTAESRWSSRRPPRKRLWLEGRTGEPVSDLENVFNLLPGPRGGLAIVTDQAGIQTVLDLAERKPLWTIPIPPEAGIPATFNETGESIRCLYEQAGRVAVARWRASDGHAEFPGSIDDTARFKIAALSASGHHLAAEMFRDKGPPRWVRELIALFGITGLNLDGNGNPVMTIEVLDASSPSKTGPVCTKNSGLFSFVLTDWFSRLQPLRGGQRFAVSDQFDISIYRFPPARNWKWLAIGCLTPIAAMTLLGWLFGRLRGLRRKHGRSAP